VTHPDIIFADDEARHAEYLAHFGVACARCGAVHEPTEHELDGLPLCEECSLAACAVFFGEALRAVEAEMAGEAVGA
jgi:hypothetical protein